MESKPAFQVISKIKVLMNKILRPYKAYGAPEDSFTIRKINNNKISLSVDSIAYDFIYDPSGSDFPVYSWRIHDKFWEQIEKLGWVHENEGGGVIHIFKK
jgi:hypothetical protein